MVRQNSSIGLRDFVARHRWLVVLLALALLLRIACVLSQDPLTPYVSGGDSWWYLDHGLKLAQATVVGPPPSAPLYLIFTGIAQQLFGERTASAVIFLRLAQSIMGTATCYFAYRLAASLHDERAGLVAAAILAVSPVLVMETAQILTETLYIFLVSGGLVAYIQLVKSPPVKDGAFLKISIVALLLGLATMTRAVLLLFPVGLALHLLLVYGWRRGLKLATALLVVYSLVCSIWTIYNLLRWDYPVIGAQGLSAFLFIGAEGWQAPDQIDENLAQNVGGDLPENPQEQQAIYQDAAVGAITRDIPGWVARRLRELTGTYLQPHGTTFFPGNSLKDMTTDWWTHDRTLTGLFALTAGDQFWPKFIIYIFYYMGLLGGLVGLWLKRRDWRVSLPLAGFILYTTLVHFLLDALPRYLFPLYIVWWIFAAAAIVILWNRLRVSRRSQTGHNPAVHQPGL